MRANLDATLALIFRWEGGFAERASEPGGSVNMGISQQTLYTWRKQHGQPVPTVDDVRNLSQGEATSIYDALYAVPIRFDDLPSGMDMATLDAAVNEGLGWALRALADAVGFEYSGVRPPVALLVEAAKTAPAAPVIDHICDARFVSKRQRAEWPRFGLGWTARIESIRQNAHALATAGTPA